MRPVALVAVLFVTAGCGESRQIVPLVATGGIPVSEPVTVPLEIVTRSTAVADPLPVRGTDVSYAEVEAALGHAIATATVPWAGCVGHGPLHERSRPPAGQLARRRGPRRRRETSSRIALCLARPSRFIERKT
jgi:hypothetical protein